MCAAGSLGPVVPVCAGKAAERGRAFAVQRGARGKCPWAVPLSFAISNASARFLAAAFEVVGVPF